MVIPFRVDRASVFNKLEKIKGFSLRCTACGKEDFGIDGSEYDPYIPSVSPLGDTNGTKYYVLICNNCAHTMFFHKHTVDGMVKEYEDREGREP
jgi:predicted nucleic-acid-binding Zn-ribbon protein